MKRYFCICNGVDTYVKAETKSEALESFKRVDEEVKIRDIRLAKLWW